MPCIYGTDYAGRGVLAGKNTLGSRIGRDTVDIGSQLSGLVVKTVPCHLRDTSNIYCMQHRALASGFRCALLRAYDALFAICIGAEIAIRAVCLRQLLCALQVLALLIDFSGLVVHKAVA
jgi:hypothetical protein